MDKGMQGFRALEPDKIFQTRGLGREDSNYRDFLPVACRFEPRAAEEKAREIMSGLLTRTSWPLHQLISFGKELAPLITREVAIKLIGRVIDADIADALPEQERSSLRMSLFNYVVCQLTPSEQLDCMTGKAFGPDYLHDVIHSLKPQPTVAIEVALQAAQDEDAAYGALVAALYGDTLITSKLESVIIAYLRAESPKLRAITFELTINHDLKVVREAHVQSEWSALTADQESYERRFGSILLVEASTKGELAVDEMLKRICPKTWFFAADRIGESVANPLMNLFLHHLRGAAEATKELSPPTTDFTLSDTEPAPFSFLQIGETDREKEQFPRQKSPKEVFDEVDNFDEKQDRLNAISDIFFKDLKGSDARLLIGQITIADLKLLDGVNLTFLPEMLEILEKVTDAQFIWFKNLAFTVANLISKVEPDRAIALFRRALASNGFVEYALGDNLTMEHEAIWSSANSEAIQTIWRERLLKSGNDAILAQEVLAAERFGASSFITTLVKELVSSPSTLDQAYAVSLAGYSSQSTKLIGCIEAHINDHGITGKAAKNAKVSHDSAQWSELWVHQMWNAQNQDEFWRYLLIAKTAIDARVSAQPEPDSPWAHFEPLFLKVRKSAIEKQDKARKKRFLGLEVPDQIFVA